MIVNFILPVIIGIGVLILIAGIIFLCGVVYEKHPKLLTNMLLGALILFTTWFIGILVLSLFGVY